MNKYSIESIGFTIILTMRIYAGIGSRKAPKKILEQITEEANRLANVGYTLRSGGAKGCDTAFAQGTNNKIIYEPNNYKFSGDGISRSYTKKQIGSAKQIAAKHHPNWHNLDNYVQKLMIRNVFILLGINLNRPVDFVYCWTPDGILTGGTGQALRIAMGKGIKIFNIAKGEYPPF